MAFCDFDLPDLPTKLGVAVSDHPSLFPDVARVALSPALQSLLRIYVPLAIANGTEKARSEFLIAPILVEARTQLGGRVSLFSGWDLVVDRANGLNGACDFIFCGSPQQEFITTPIAIIVEAKNDNIKSGLGQCGAAMVAARMFNEEPVVGYVSTGTSWRFLRLDGATLYIDQKEYYLANEADEIMGILISALRDRPATSEQAA
jgi:hypothetical protein